MSNRVWIVAIDEPVYYGRLYAQLIQEYPGRIGGVIVMPGVPITVAELGYRLRLWGVRGCAYLFSRHVAAWWRRSGDLETAARNAKVPVAKATRLEEAVTWIHAQPGGTEAALVLATVTRVVPAAVFESSGARWSNVHCGPLPRYAGVDAPFWCLFNGEPLATVTIHYMAEAVDAGPIMFQESVPAASRSYFQILDALFALALQGYRQILDSSDWPVPSRPQDLTQRTVVRKPAARLGREFRKRGLRIV